MIIFYSIILGMLYYSFPEFIKPYIKARYNAESLVKDKYVLLPSQTNRKGPLIYSIHA